MPEIQLTPEQEKRARESFQNRVFDPDEYSRSIMGPEASPEIQVEIAEQTLRAMDPALKGEPVDPLDLETLAVKREKALEAAEEFWFLDPKDYADEKASIGRTMLPIDLWYKLKYHCGLNVWFSLANEAVIAKELNPRDVALAYRKIGTNPENLHNPERWNDAIAEIKQEEAQRQPMHNYERFGIYFGDRDPAGDYITWIPGCTLREYAIVKFDSHGVPDFHIPGWRDVLIAIVRKQYRTQEQLEAVFGAATGPRSKRYQLIMHGLRNRPYRDEDGEVPAEIGGAAPVACDTGAPAVPPVASEAAKSTRCDECFWGYGVHQDNCSKAKAVKKAVKNSRKRKGVA